MPTWFRRRRARPAPTIASRSDAVEVARIDLADFAPAPEAYLGRLAYLSIVLFENVGRAVAAAPTVRAKAQLGVAAAELLAIQRGVLDELEARRIDPVQAMEPYRADLDDFQRRTAGSDWHEILVTCYLTAGFLLDFEAGLAAGLPRPLGDRVTSLLDVGRGEALLAEELRRAIDASPRLASRLAMWGRRLVGDAMLSARSGLVISGELPAEDRIQPVFTELIAAHTRRMDALGLTA